MTDEPQRRRRWSDDLLTERFDTVAVELSVLRALPLEVAKAHLRIDGIVKEFGDVKEDVAAVEQRLGSRIDEVEQRLCKQIEDEARAQGDFRREYRRNREADAKAQQEERKTRRGDQTARVVAWIGGSAMVVAALVTAITQILGASS